MGASGRDPLLAGDIGGRFDHVLVDEYQDTNRLQSSILMALKPGGEGLHRRRRRRESIYSFRAASVRNILDFPTAFRPPAEIITLERNYRSTQPILASANGVIDLAAERFTKNLWTERQSGDRPRLVGVRDEADQARYVVEKVLDNRERGAALKQQAVLFRTSHHSGPLEVELTRRNIPFVKFGGLKFLDSAHVKDMLAMLRFAQNPRDRVAGFRLMQLLPGVGPTSAQRALDVMADRPDPIAALVDMPPPPRAGEDWRDFVETLLRLRAGEAGWPAEIAQARRWYEPHLDRIHDDAAVRQADLLQLEQIAAGYPSRERFLTELTLDPPDATSDQAGAPHLDNDLSDPFHHPFRQRAGMEVGVYPQCRRRLYSVRSRRGNNRGNRGRAPAALRRHDAGKGRSASLDAAALLHPWPDRAGRSSCLASRTRFIPAALLQHFDISAWPLATANPAGGLTRDNSLSMSARACAACGDRRFLRCV